jgi:hypothetical protein
MIAFSRRAGVRAADLVRHREFGTMVALKGTAIVGVPLAEAGHAQTVPRRSMK